VPKDGEVVLLRYTANLSTGGTAIDVTDVIHPDNREMAERAIKAVGLDIGGVDFLSQDITVSYKDNGAGICEVNAGPGFRMHVAPSEGKPRDIAGKVMDMMFPPGTRSRVPIAALTGTNGKTTTARMLAHILRWPATTSASPPRTPSTSTATSRERRHDRAPRPPPWCCATRRRHGRARNRRGGISERASAGTGATSAPC
jgi:hypothetical protein